MPPNPLVWLVPPPTPNLLPAPMQWKIIKLSSVSNIRDIARVYHSIK